MPEVGDLCNYNGHDVIYKGKGIGWVREHPPMLDRFVQIVITRNPDGTFHVTWQDEHRVVKSGDYWGIGGVVTEMAHLMEVPSHARAFAKA